MTLTELRPIIRTIRLAGYKKYIGVNMYFKRWEGMNGKLAYTFHLTLEEVALSKIHYTQYLERVEKEAIQAIKEAEQVKVEAVNRKVRTRFIR